MRKRLGISRTLAGLGLAARGGPSQPSRSGDCATPSPSASSAPFVIDLPIAAGDGATLAYGIWPYGVHGGGHAVDGHGGGLDIEHRVGAPVLAAAGVVESVIADARDPDRKVVHLTHARDRGQYRTDYGNLLAVPDRAAYRAELCEPFLTNSRAHSFPIARTWTRQSGNGPSTIELTCVSESEPTYVMTNDGALVESGSLTIGWSDIVSETMRLASASPSAITPTGRRTPPN